MRRATITGRARFLYLAAEQVALSLPLATMQTMGGAETRDRVSLLMIKTREGVEIERTRSAIARRLPRVTAIATADAVRKELLALAKKIPDSPLKGAKLDDVILADGKIVSRQDASRAVSIADAMRHGGVERIEQQI